jgi:hypothetical protein
MFVPSLSWQNIRFFTAKWRQKGRFSEGQTHLGIESLFLIEPISADNRGVHLTARCGAMTFNLNQLIQSINEMMNHN